MLTLTQDSVSTPPPSKRAVIHKVRPRISLSQLGNRAHSAQSPSNQSLDDRDDDISTRPAVAHQLPPRAGLSGVVKPLVNVARKAGSSSVAPTTRSTSVAPKAGSATTASKEKAATVAPKGKSPAVVPKEDSATVAPTDDGDALSLSVRNLVLHLQAQDEGDSIAKGMLEEMLNGEQVFRQRWATRADAAIFRLTVEALSKRNNDVRRCNEKAASALTGARQKIVAILGERRQAVFDAAEKAASDDRRAVDEQGDVAKEMEHIAGRAMDTS
jgi:hypothetical protein